MGYRDHIRAALDSRGSVHILGIHQGHRPVGQHIQIRRIPRRIRFPWLRRTAHVHVVLAVGGRICLRRVHAAWRIQAHDTYIDVAHDDSHAASDALYRNNRQSSLIETELGNYGIPYVVLGGMRFYDREEILNALAYAKVIINQNDDTSLLRIINVPSRKIGPAVIRELSAVAKERGISLYVALKEVYKYVEIDKKTDNKALVKLAKKISEFYSLIENLKKQKDNDLQDFMKNLIEQTGLREYYQLKDEKEQNKFKDNMREENLLELVNNAHIFNKSYERMFADVNEEEAQISPLTAFISNITLIGSGEMDEKGSTDEIDEGAVRLMTIHSAKGLEFNVVIVAGMEKNIRPSVRSEKNKDEERRLAYVAITRAKEKLVLTYAMKRYNFAQELETTGASPFIEEIISGFDDELKALPYKYVNNQNML